LLHTAVQIALLSTFPPLLHNCSVRPSAKLNNVSNWQRR
jgi:hypothetical protein